MPAFPNLSQDLPYPRMRSRARSFYLATFFLPADLRRDVQTIYTFCRIVDDLVDEPPPGATHADILDVLDRWEDSLASSVPTDPLLAGVCHVIAAYSLSPQYFRMLLDGARMDLTLTHLETRHDLYVYSLHVAGSVGMILAEMMGARHETALEAARDLGVAMQLTNILRDVAEDLDRSRIYLPREVMAETGCSTATLRARDPSPGFKAAMREIAGEARSRYVSGVAGIHLLDPGARFAVFLAATLYAGILDKIEDRDYNVFSGRVHLGTMEKWSMAVPLYVRHRRHWTAIPYRVH